AEDAKEKKRIFEKAINLDPENPDVYSAFVLSLRDSGDFDGARAVIKNAITASEKIRDPEVKDRFEAKKKEMEKVLIEMDETDAVIDGIADKEVVSTVNLIEGITTFTGTFTPAEKQRRLSAFRTRLSERVKGAFRDRIALRRFYRDSVGDKREVPAVEVQIQVEASIAQVKATEQIDTLKSQKDKKEAVQRIIETGEKLLSQGRLEDLEQLLYLADQSGISDGRLDLLQTRRLIAAAGRVVSSSGIGWEKDASDREAVILSQIEITAGSENKVRARLEFAAYYRNKASRSTDEKKRKEAGNSAKSQYLSALDEDQFSLEALKGLAALPGTQTEVAQKVSTALGSKKLKDQSGDIKSGLLALISANSGNWKKAGADVPLDKNVIDNFGQVPPKIAAEMIDLAFKTANYAVIPDIIGNSSAVATSAGDAIIVLDALDRGLAGLSPEDLSRAAGIVDDKSLKAAMDKLSRVGRSPEKSKLEAQVALVWAYISMGRGEFGLAAGHIASARSKSGYIVPDARLAEVKMRIARGDGFLIPGSWALAVMGLTAEAKRIASSDMAGYIRAKAVKEKPAADEKMSAEQVGDREKPISDNSRIRRLQRAIMFEPGSVELHKELKRLYDQTRQRRSAAVEAMIVMELLLERGDNRGVVGFYENEVKNIEQYYKTASPQRLADLNGIYGKAIAALTPGRPAAFEALTLDTGLTGGGFFGPNEKDGLVIQNDDGAVNPENVEAVKGSVMASSRPHTKVFYGKDTNIYVERELETVLTRFGVDVDMVINDALKVHQARGQIPDNIVISLLDRSNSLFEDHTRNGFIGINRYFLKTIDGMDKGAVEALLVLGISHELYHEIYPEAREAEVLMFSRGVLNGIDSSQRTEVIKVLRTVISPSGIAALAPPIMIGIAGADRETLAAMTEKYDSVQFVEAVGVSSDDMLKDMENKAGPPRRFLVDMSREDLEKNMPSIVRKAERQAFVVTYPYLAGLDERGVRGLGDVSLKDAFGVIRAEMLEERPMDMDDIIGSLADMYESGLAGQGPVNVMVRPENTDEWVAENVKAVQTFNSADLPQDKAEAADRILAMKQSMNEYLTGKSPAEVARIMSYHQGVAAARRVEEDVSGLLAEYISAGILPDRPQAVVIDARGKPEEALRQMLPALKAYSGVASLLRVCIVTDMDIGGLAEEEGIVLPDNVTTFTMADGEMDVISGAQDHLASLGIEMPPEFMSAVTKESPRMTDYVVGHVAGGGQLSAGFVVIGEETTLPDEYADRVNRLLPSFAVMNLLRRAVESKPNIFMIGCREDTEEKIAASLKDIICSVVRISKIDIGKEISGFIESLRSIATSL
ncbi:MAG: hypothetical protein PHT95_03405, partial [Candidatus Omnitrophica bacterium]|nr:hypothetical protein [Candidatus Omnitrophota bacterium]